MFVKAMILSMIGMEGIPEPCMEKYVRPGISRDRAGYITLDDITKYTVSFSWYNQSNKPKSST
jgi:hypothetical protein